MRCFLWLGKVSRGGDETKETEQAKIGEKSTIGRGPEARKHLARSVWLAKSFGQHETADLRPSRLSTGLYLPVLPFVPRALSAQRTPWLSRGRSAVISLRALYAPPAVPSSCFACLTVPPADTPVASAGQAAQGETWLSSTSVSPLPVHIHLRQIH